MFYFLSANVDRSTEIVAKVAELNRGREGEFFKPALLREVNAMTAEDWKTFGNWLCDQGTPPKKSAIVSKLNELKYHRLAMWHVYQAPAELVPDDKSMLLRLTLTPPFFFFLFVPQRQKRRCSLSSPRCPAARC